MQPTAHASHSLSTFSEPSRAAINQDMTKCKNCQLFDVDKDPDGYKGEYCSDSCKADALRSGEATKSCKECKTFPAIMASDCCGWLQCRRSGANAMCYLCKIKRVYDKSTLWCCKKCRDNTPNWSSLVRERSNQPCLVCGQQNSFKGRDCCRDECKIWIKHYAPCLLKVPPTSQKFYDITRQFETAWKHTYKTLPEIHSIWKICCPENLIRRYNEYRDEVEKRQKLAEKPFPKGQGQRRVMTAGNEQRRFHGTSMKCLLNLLSSESQRVLCLDPQCSLCGIIRCGYSLKHAGTSAVSATFQRFGPGIYFSGTSSKSDDYNEGSATFYNGEKYKAMLLNKLIVGRGFTETKDNVQLTEPPPGYDSVLGEPRITSNLNYDEVVVYDERACLPKYLIIYKCPKTIAIHKEPM